MSVVVVGSCNLDFIVEVPALPKPGQTVLGGDVSCRPGGKGANQAVAARRLGADTVFVSAIGNDEFGTSLRAALEAEGMDLSSLVTIDSPTGVALIVVDSSATNQITVAPGANRHLSHRHVEPLRAMLSPASVLLLQLEIPLTTCLAAARIAREAGATVVVNAAPLTTPNETGLGELLATTDVLVVNETEALTLGAPAATPVDIDAWLGFAARTSAVGPSSVVVTLGEGGAVAAESGEAFHVASHPVEAVDTTGAGDAFCGAVAAALSYKHSLREAVRSGCMAGALATTAVGAQSALPRKSDIDRLIARAGGA